MDEKIIKEDPGKWNENERKIMKEGAAYIGARDVESGGGRVRHGSPIYYELLGEMAETHDRKSHDYASNSDPYGNYYFAGHLACLFSHSPEDAGFIGRLGEKFYRLANLERAGKTAINESIEDTERDIAVISALWMASRRDRRKKNTPSPSEGDWTKPY